jgi:hypothetical protein
MGVQCAGRKHHEKKANNYPILNKIDHWLWHRAAGSVVASLFAQLQRLNSKVLTMSQKDYEKGKRDGRIGIYQPPHQRVFGPRSVSTPKQIDQDRQDYRLGYMVGQQEATEKQFPAQKWPVPIGRPRDQDRHP